MRHTEEDKREAFAIWGFIQGYTSKMVIYGELYGEDSPWKKEPRGMF